MPDTTRSNGPPNTPSRENMTHNAGGPVTDQASGTQSISTRRTSGRIRWRVPSAVPAPEYSRSGAATTTSPSSTSRRARTWSPTASTPSSLVTRMRTGPSYRGGGEPAVNRSGQRVDDLDDGGGPPGGDAEGVGDLYAAARVEGHNPTPTNATTPLSVTPLASLTRHRHDSPRSGAPHSYRAVGPRRSAPPAPTPGARPAGRTRAPIHGTP